MFLVRNCIQAVAAMSVLAAGGQALASGSPPPASKKPRIDKMQARAMLEQASSHFTENKGQWGGDGRFVSRSNSADVWVTGDGALFDFHAQRARVRTGQVVRLRFAGTKGAVTVGQNPDRGRFGYDHAKKRISAQRFASVLQEGVYRGIDARYYVDEKHPRYDLIVAPNADPGQIAMRYSGAARVSVKPNALVFGTILGDVQETKLVAYQTDAHGRHNIPASFVSRADGTVGFKLGAYDHSRGLVIDPLVYGSYYGGEDGWDEIRAVAETTLNNAVYMVGYTQSVKFPALEGPYQFNLNGPQDGFVAELEGDAYANIYATFVGGSLSDVCSFAQLDQQGNLWVAGSTQSADFPSNTRQNIEYLRLYQDGIGDVAPAPNGGSIILDYGGFDTAELAWDQDDTTVFNQLNSLPGVTIDSPPGVTGKLPGTIRIPMDNSSPGGLSVTSNYVGGGFGNFNQNPEIPDYNEGLEPRYLIDLNAATNPTANIITRRGSTPTGGTFAISFNNNATIDTTAAIPYNATPTQVATALNALGNLNGGKFQCAGSSLPPQYDSVAYGASDPFAPMPNGAQNNFMQITFQPTSMSAFGPVSPSVLYISYANLALTNGGPAIPVSEMQVHVPSNLFVQRWGKTTSTGLLNPLPTQCLIFGGDQDNTMSGFAVQQGVSVTNNTVTLGWAGNEDDGLEENTVDPVTGAYIARYTWDPTNGFKKVAVKYLGEALPLLIGGFAMDTSGNGYVAGEIEFSGNDNNPTGDGLFTTRGGWGDNYLRFRDIFLRKYNPTMTATSATGANGLIFSGVLGGNDDDFIGGFDWDPDGTVENTGSAVAVDAAGNAYITGVTQSFDFPRTRNVVGPVFVSQPAATCFASKISSDGTQLLYSTSLNTQTLEIYSSIFPHRIGIGLGNEWLPSPVMPAGIAVDTSGDAFISGNAHPQWVGFPDPASMPGNPNQPAADAFPVIPLQNPISGSYNTVATPDYPGSSGWLTVLNSTAQNFIFSSWLTGSSTDGGLALWEQVYAPYVNQFGDVWVMGTFATHRYYVRGLTIYDDGSALPSELISPLAFKSVGDSGGGGEYQSIYGAYQHQPEWGSYESFPLTVPMEYATDGWLSKLRLVNPSISSFTFAPGTIPGGFGANSTGTVTLSAAAPAGGANIQISINTNAASASLAQGSQVSSETLTIPAGATTVTFPIYSNAVLTTTSVQVQATYLGSFQIAQLDIIPWLQSIGITPNSIVGGNSTSGLVTLAMPAPAAGIQVSLTSDHPSLISFPGGNTLVVPPGQTSATFTVQTSGVEGTSPNAGATITNVSASVGGVNVSTPLSLLPAGVLSLSFNPTVITALGTTQGTVTLNGQAGPAFTTTLSGLPAGFQYVVGSKTYTSTGASMTVPFPIATGQTSATFGVNTPYESAQMTETVVVTQPASANYLTSSASGSFIVTTASLQDITMTPNPVAGGATTVGEVDLRQPAPTGGVIVQLAGNPTYVTFSNQTGNPVLTNIGAGTATLTIPAGSTFAQFNVGPTPVSGTQITTPITATRGTSVVSTNLVILPATIGVSLSQTSTIGGVNTGVYQVVGTVALNSAAGPNGVKIDLQATIASGNPPLAISIPSQVTVPAGQSSVNFNVTSTAVTVNQLDNIYFWADSPSTPKGNHPANASFTQLLVTAPGIASVTFISLANGQVVSSVTGGTTVKVIVNLPAGVTAPTSGLPVSISVENSQFTTFPATVTMPGGSSSVSFNLVTRRVSRSQTATLTATTAGAAASAPLTVNPGF